MERCNHRYAAALAAGCLLLVFSGCLLCEGPRALLGGPPLTAPPPGASHPLPALTTPTQAAVQPLPAAPQARFHPVPVRPVFLPGSYATPGTLQQVPDVRMPQFQRTQVDEPPIFPEPEEVGPPEAQNDGEAMQSKDPQAQAPRHTATQAAWFFAPAKPRASRQQAPTPATAPSGKHPGISSPRWKAAGPHLANST